MKTVLSLALAGVAASQLTAPAAVNVAPAAPYRGLITPYGGLAAPYVGLGAPYTGLGGFRSPLVSTVARPAPFAAPRAPVKEEEPEEPESPIPEDITHNKDVSNAHDSLSYVKPFKSAYVASYLDAIKGTDSGNLASFMFHDAYSHTVDSLQRDLDYYLDFGYLEEGYNPMDHRKLELTVNSFDNLKNSYALGIMSANTNNQNRKDDLDRMTSFALVQHRVQEKQASEIELLQALEKYERGEATEQELKHAQLTRNSNQMHAMGEIFGALGRDSAETYLPWFIGAGFETEIAQDGVYDAEDAYYMNPTRENARALEAAELELASYKTLQMAHLFLRRDDSRMDSLLNIMSAQYLEDAYEIYHEDLQHDTVAPIYEPYGYSAPAYGRVAAPAYGPVYGGLGYGYNGRY